MATTSCISATFAIKGLPLFSLYTSSSLVVGSFKAGAALTRWLMTEINCVTLAFTALSSTPNFKITGHISFPTSCSKHDDHFDRSDRECVREYVRQTHQSDVHCAYCRAATKPYLMMAQGLHVISHRFQFFFLGQGYSRSDPVKRGHVPSAGTHSDLREACSIVYFYCYEIPGVEFSVPCLCPVWQQTSSCRTHWKQSKQLMRSLNRSHVQSSKQIA